VSAREAGATAELTASRKEENNNMLIAVMFLRSPFRDPSMLTSCISTWVERLPGVQKMPRGRQFFVSENFSVGAAFQC